MYLTGSEQQALRGVFTLLAQDRGESDIRERLGWALLDLLHADQFASFVWNAESGRFDGRVALNMDPANLDRYGEWHQHHDPITFVLQSHRRATSGIVAHLGEVDARRIHVARGFSSLFEYCTKELGFSEERIWGERTQAPG